MIYFIQAASGPVKVGVTRNVATRLKGIQADNHEELKVIRVIDGMHADEISIHRQIEHLRIRGEWFRYSPELMTVTAIYPATRGVAGAAIERAVNFCGSVAELARRIGHDEEFVTDALKGRRQICRHHAIDIERATNGHVNRAELRPIEGPKMRPMGRA